MGVDSRKPHCVVEIVDGNVTGVTVWLERAGAVGRALALAENQGADRDEIQKFAESNFWENDEGTYRVQVIEGEYRGG